MRAIMQRQLPLRKSLNVNSPRRAANGAFLRSDAHVPNVRSASVLGKHHFRHPPVEFSVRLWPFRRTFHYKIHSGFDRINARAAGEVAKNCFFAGLDFTRP